MTYSEMRSSYEVMKEQNREIIIGSTNIWNPSTFVDSLKGLDKTQRVEGEYAAPPTSRNSIMPRQSVAQPPANRSQSVTRPPMPPMPPMPKDSGNGSRDSLVIDEPPLASKGTMRGLRGKFTVKRKP